MEVNSFAQIDPIISRPSDSELAFYLGDMSKGKIRSFAGRIVGPQCAYARTLPATYSIPACQCEPNVSHCTSVTIMDPCYWTPRLPFLYDFHGDIHDANGKTTHQSHTVGFRRWEINGRNFLLERKRTVLRGAVATKESEIDLEAAHDAEMVVLADNPSEGFLQHASECGVMIVADLRSGDFELTSKLLSFSWQPSVALVLPKMDACYIPHSQFLGDVMHCTDDLAPTPPDEDWSQVVLVELNEGERPPSELKEIDKPMVAIRRGVEFADLHAARAACDRLQAELAPEFDLAGYFVAP